MQKTVYGLILSAHFPDNRPLLSFLFFFLGAWSSIEGLKKSSILPCFSFCFNFQGSGKNRKRQVLSAVNTWNSAMLLCAVTEVYRRQVLTRVKGSGSECRLYTGGTWENGGKQGKQTRRKMVLDIRVKIREPRTKTEW